MIASAFTCTGPYAILIMMGVKKVENRSAMPVPVKGRCAVSCSKSFCKEEFGEVVATADDAARAFRAAVSIAGGNEGFFVLPLDAERRALAAPILVSLGESTTTTVDPGEVFSAALGVGAKAIVVAHNHPSGDTTPSAQDRELTASLERLGDALGVAVLDHLVIGGDLFSRVRVSKLQREKQE